MDKRINMETDPVTDVNIDSDKDMGIYTGPEMGTDMDIGTDTGHGHRHGQ
jgi:hypothetical protein